MYKKLKLYVICQKKNKVGTIMIKNTNNFRHLGLLYLKEFIQYNTVISTKVIIVTEMAHSTFSHRLQFWPYYFENVLGHLVNSIEGKHLIFVKK